MIVVSNAGPLIALGKLNAVHLLVSLYGKVLISENVYNEVIVRGLIEGYPDAIILDIYYKSGNIEKKRITDSNLVNNLANSYFIQIGEVETIVLSEQEKADIALIDDLKPRQLARERGLNIKGTLGVLVEALKKRYINKNELEILIRQIIERNDIWISKELCEQVLSEIDKYVTSNKS